MAGVTLTDTSKIYPRSVKAVDRVNLNIADGEFLVLVGPSGCGKSTTLRLVAGLEPVSAGAIKIGDRVVNDIAPKDRDVAMVFQDHALYPHLSARRNMAFGLMMRRKELGLSQAEIDRQVREAAALLGIADLLDRKPRELSGGERQRVAVGRAMVRHPQVFLFDEPLSNLDARMRVEMRAEIKQLQRKLKTTTIYVTHDPEEALTLGDRVAGMKDGAVLQVAAPREVYERPANRSVAALIGTSPMSFIEGRIGRRPDGWFFEDGAAGIPLPPRWAPRDTAGAGRPLVLGIRPEALALQPQGENDSRIQVRIRMIEPMGDRKNLHMTTLAQVKLVGRVDSRVTVFEGQELPMFLDWERAYVFEPGESGVNVTASYAGVGSGGH